MFHPSQLEKRFGGECETPTNFWPPHMGTQFIPEEEKNAKQTLISPQDYDRITSENPELYVHPQSLKPGMSSRNLHFKLEGEDEG